MKSKYIGVKFIKKSSVWRASVGKKKISDSPSEEVAVFDYNFHAREIGGSDTPLNPLSALFGHHGMRGDLAINLPAIEFLAKNAGVRVDMPINKIYADMVPIFLNNPVINSVIITDEYENYPSEKDIATLRARAYTHLLHPMQPHRKDDWWKHYHQTSAVLVDYCGKELPEDCQQINLTKWFDEAPMPKTIAFAPFAGQYGNKTNKKRLSVERAQEIVDQLRFMGYKVLHLGAADEPVLKWAANLGLPYFESVRHMLGCELLIHTDTGLGWIASGYKFKQIGLYSNADFKEFTKNIQPKNPNSTYLEASSVNDIPIDNIVKAVETMVG